MQIASMVIEEGGDARTINLCKLCCKCKACSAGQTATKIERMERGVGEEGTSDRLWKVVGCEQLLRGMWEYFISLSKGHGQGQFFKKNKQKIQVNGNKNLSTKKFWSKSKEVRMQIAVTDNAPCVQRNEAWQLGKF